MIGSGLKKFAREKGLKLDRGVAFGDFGGYAVTLDEGSGFKRLCVATAFPVPGQKDAFQQALNSYDLTGTYRILQLTLIPNGIVVIFTDTVGTLKKIREFADILLPLLQEHDAEQVQVCNECHSLITDDGCWMLREGVFSSHVHTGCLSHAIQQASDELAQQQAADTGSYATGILGALLGSVLGSIVWALVLSFGYVASLVGLLIGFLSEKGYSLLKGRQGKAKIAILIFAVILGVLLGTYGGCVLQVLSVMNEEGIPSESFGLVLEFVMQDSAGKTGMLTNFLTGLLFAGLGVFGMLHQQSKQLRGQKIQVLRYKP